MHSATGKLQLRAHPLRRAIDPWLVLCGLLMALTVGSGSAAAAANTEQAALSACGFKPAPPGMIVQADAKGGLVLDDGRKLRLSDVWMATPDNLLRQVIGREIIPYPAAKQPDRTGYLPAHIIVKPDVTMPYAGWLQADLLARGQAFLYIYPDQTSCAEALYSSEKSAQMAGIGIWKLDLSQKYPIFSTGDMEPFFVGTVEHLTIERAAGRYGIIRGVVLSTGSAGRWRYLNFGQNYAQDFTVRMTAGVEKHFVDIGFPLQALKSRRVEIRGVIQSKGGPMIDIFNPAQIVIEE